MKIPTTCITLLLVASCWSSYSQNVIVLHGTASGSHAALPLGTTYQISGSFGQPVINSNGTILSSGFYAAAGSLLQENTAPIISPTAFTVINLSTATTIQATITDDDGIVNPTLHYRNISENINDNDFHEEDLSATSQANTYEVNINNLSQPLDDMGLEYFFTAEDGTGRERRFPVSDQPNLFAYLESDEITIPNERFSAGSSQSNYRIISTPYTVGSNDVATLFSALNPESGYSTSLWRLFSHTGENEFDAYPGGETAKNLIPGKGYWFIVSASSNREVILSPNDQVTVTAPQFNQNELFDMPLQSGWNMVGNPYAVTISWENVRAANPSVDISEIKIYTGAYANGDDLRPFQGGVVYLDGADATIQIPFKGQTVAGSRQLIAKEESSSTANWSLDFKMEQNGQINRLGGFGMHSEASDTKDRWDDLNPPRFLSYLEMNFAHNEHQLGYFSKDVVSPKSINKWKFEVNSSADENITLGWNPANLPINSPELYLYNPSTQELVDMKTVHKLEVANNSSLEIYYGEHVLTEIGPEIPFINSPYPNPVNTDLGLASFPLMLSGKNMTYEVTAKIFSMEGREVKQIFVGELNSGQHTITWDGKSQNNEVSNAGLYIYRIGIRSQMGEWKFTGKLVISN